MIRALIAVTVLLVACIVAIAAAVMSAGDEDASAVDTELAQSLTRAVARGGELRMDRLAPFEWDRLIVAADGAPRPAISRALGATWEGELNIQAGPLLIFADGSRVVRFADYRGDRSFEGLATPVAVIPRAQAVFSAGASVVGLASR